MKVNKIKIWNSTHNTTESEEMLVRKQRKNKYCTGNNNKKIKSQMERKKMKNEKCYMKQKDYKNLIGRYMR